MKLLVQGKKPGIHAEQCRLDAAGNCAHCLLEGESFTAEYFAYEWKMWTLVWRFWLHSPIPFIRTF